MDIEVNNKTKCQIAKKDLKEIAEKAFEYLFAEKVINAKKISLSIALVSEEEIKKINKRYRKKNQSTDVLSFCYEKKSEEIVGEIILCLKVIKKNAVADKESFRKELKKNIIHGILHIIGLRHGERMFMIQEGILKRR